MHALRTQSIRKSHHLPMPLRLLLCFVLLLLVGGGSGNAAASDDFDELQILLRLKSSLGINDWKEGNSTCSFPGITCDSSGSVSGIDLTNRRILGTIPFGSLCRLPALAAISFGSNYLSGEVADELRSCVNLVRLDLAFNSLTGSVPDLSALTKLRVLNLSDNSFTGDFPWSSFGGLSQLEVLSLGDNFFDPSPFPTVVLNLTKLNWLYISNCNIHGEIPPAIGNLTELVDLELADNFLTGGIPPEIGRLSKLWQLELYNNSLTGKIPAELGNLSELAFFDASMNTIEGDLSVLRSLKKLVSLQLFNNNLTGEVPLEFGEFRYLVNLSLYSNRLIGMLPAKLGSWAKFNFIDVSTNFLTGEIPPDMCRMGTMQKLLMLENNFTGGIPTSYANCPSLIRFRVSNNLLSGEVPAGLWSLPNLNIIDLATNQFEGGVGPGIGGAKSLYQLYLQNNQFTGGLPPEIGKSTSLVSIDVTNNRFSGDIPATIGGLQNLVSLSLQHNTFSGEIPASIGSCVSLNTMSLAGNNLSGPIPASLGQLTRLNSLDLSNNQLSGEIPDSLGSLKLSALDLSDNHLSGAVPVALSIAAYNESFAGNPGLCVNGDTNSLRSVGQCPIASGSFDDLRTVVFFVAGTVLLLASVGLFILKIVRLQSERGVNKSIGKNSSWDVKSFRILTFDEQEIVDSIKQENLIGKGGSGEVYRVELANGEVVAVKHIWNEPITSGKERSTTAMLGRRKRRPATKEFDAEVGTLSTIRHVNVVNLHCCITSEDCSLLVYEYLPKGSLWERLHTVEGGKLGGLDWEARYEIAIGAAKGLEYLHHGWERPILHRDVKSSNILLDEFFKPRIADFGLAKVLHSTAGGAKDCSSTHVIAGTHGYIAPEYAYTWKVNEKSDVYSFGVVLMELVTGKRPIEPEYGENKDIVYWVAMKINNRESVVALVDKRISEWATEEALKVLRVAVLCTARLPSMRPSMRTVVQMLEEAGSYRGFRTVAAGEEEKRTGEYKADEKEQGHIVISRK